MEEIKKKIAELLSLNGKSIQWDDRMKQQNKLFAELKALARANHTFLGRRLDFPMADSSAVYVISKVNKNTVQLRWVEYCDAWMDSRLGENGSVPLDYAKKQINFADYWEQMVADRKAENAVK